MSVHRHVDFPLHPPLPGPVGLHRQCARPNVRVYTLNCVWSTKDNRKDFQGTLWLHPPVTCLVDFRISCVRCDSRVLDRSCTKHNWYLKACFFSTLSLLSVMANTTCHSTATFKMLLYHNSESGNWWFGKLGHSFWKKASKQ